MSNAESGREATSIEASQPYARPLPAITNLNRRYWDELREHRLVVPRCNTCGRHWFPPGPWCPYCWSRNHEWVTLSGRGRVSSWVVFHQPYFRAFADDVPYHVVEVELAEGPRILSSLVDVPNDKIAVGLEVEICFDDVMAELTLPRFRARAT